MSKYQNIYIEVKFEDETFYKEGEKKVLKSRNFKKVLGVLTYQFSNKKANKNGFVDIHNSKFKKAYSNYNEYLEYLIINDYVERSSYTVGKKAYGYRFTERYKRLININEIVIPMCYHAKHKKRKKSQKDDTVSIINDDTFKRLKRDFRSCEVNLNYDSQKAFVEKTKDEWGSFIDIGKWLSNNVKLVKMQKKLWFFHFKNYRIYSNFTQLSSHARLDNIKLNEERIVEFDISNSFPLMLAKYIVNNYPDSVNDYDFQNYTTQVLDGSFYKELQIKLNQLRNCYNPDSECDNRLLSKSEVKILFQKFLNDSYKKMGYSDGVFSDINKFFELKYPIVFDVLKEIKDNEEKVYVKLVELESKLIFDIVTDLYSRYNDIKLLSCHDAIYCPASYKDRVQEVWDYHYKKFIDYIPRESNYVPLELYELISVDF